MSFFEKKKVGLETLGEYLHDTRGALNLSILQVMRLTRIPEKYLQSLEAGDYDHLPADVYVKGFLKSLAAVYRMPAEALLAQFEKERGVERSLKVDPLRPRARKVFRMPNLTITPRTLTLTLVAILTLLSVGYLVWQIRSVSAPPELALEFPDSDITIGSRSMLLRGHTEAGSRVYINGQEVLVEEAGSFKEIMNLAEGGNTIVVKAENKFGKISSLERQIVVSSAPLTSATTTPLIDEQKIAISILVGPESAWIAVTADGRNVQSGVVNSGQKIELTADNELVLSTGNAGATRVIYNGKDLGLLGRAGEVLSNIRFTK